MTMFSLLISFVNRELACAVDSIRQPWLSFKDDFSFYSDSVFADDFWTSTGIVCLMIPCVKHESIFAIGLCVARLFFDAVDTIRQLPLIFQLWFQGVQGLCFSLRFQVSSDSIFTHNFMRQRWLFSLLISFVNHELACAVDSIRQPWLSFKDDFSFYSDSVFADDFWISTSIVCLTIPCVKHEYIFAIGFTRRSWILWRCRLHTLVVTHISVAISRSTVTLFYMTISG
jgi:hypothetical protein